MAAQDGSDDFDLTGVTASDGDDEDFDWASLDEPEQAATAHPQGGYKVKAGSIPFQDTPASEPQSQIAPSSTSSQVPFEATSNKHAMTPPAQHTRGPGSDQSAHIVAGNAASTPSPPLSLSVAAGAGPLPANAVGVQPGQTGPAAPPAAAAVLSSPDASSLPERPRSAGVAAGPPAPRYAAGTVNSPQPAGSDLTARSASPALTTTAKLAAAAPAQPPPDPGRPAQAVSPQPVAQARQSPVQQQDTATAAPTTAAAVHHPLDSPAAASEAAQAPTTAAVPSQEGTTIASAQPGTASSSSSQQPGGVGGSWGWGFTGLSSKLQQVAMGAAKDLQELTASVQQAVAEVVAADDVSDVDKLSAYQTHPSRPPAPPAVSTATPPAALAVSRDSQSQLPTIHEPPGEEEVGSPSVMETEEQRRVVVLKKLQGRDTQLEAGLKVIDEQVDLLAASAAKAFGSLWGGFSNVAKTGWTVGQAITTKVEAAAKEVAKELAVGLEEGAHVVTPVTTLAERIAAQAEKGLESVGRVGASLLEPQFTSRDSSHQRHTPSDWAATFDSCFELYGGSQAAEELEQLSSECAGICNRARAKLQEVHREQIDATLSKLVPAFDLSSQQQQAHTAEGSSVNTNTAEPEQPVEISDTMQEGLDHMYLPVAALCNKGKHKVQQLQEEAEASAPDAAAEDATTARADQQAEITTAEATDEARQEGPHSSSSSKVEALLRRLLSVLRSTAVKSLAEVSAGQLMVLLALGRSVAAVPRYGKPLDDGLEWPAEPEVVAAVMRQQVQRMMSDIQQLSGGFKATAPQLLSLLQAACARVAGVGGGYLSSEVAQQQASLLVEEVTVDCNTAVRHITDGFSKLLYVVLLSSLHRASAPARPDEAAETVQQGEHSTPA